MDVLEQAAELVEEVLAHASDLDDYDVQRVAEHVALLASIEYDGYDPRQEA